MQEEPSAMMFSDFLACAVCIVTQIANQIDTVRLFLHLSSNICLKKDMAEQIAGDLVRKSKVFLFPYFLFCEKQICCQKAVER